MASPFKKIMVYIDGTEESITAAQFALCLSKTTEADLLAVYIINIKALHDLVKARIFLKDEQAEYEHDLKNDAQRYLNYVHELAQSKNVSITTKSVTGSVHQEIIRIVKEEQIDLLILGELAHVRSRRDEFYDEAERAMRSVPCSVLIVKDEERVWELFHSLE